ncbi:nitroreductase family protein [Nakamurella lactea]|uniref:nitroreductase family protein n=1 Tax=Nakamurella lactea TaxID=459515 RepID=UPI0003F73765|nr:nitroreductase family protein [Nakamurella lactea]
MIKRLIRLAKQLLAVTWIRRVYEGTTRGLLEVGAANRVTATLFSIPGLLTFNREQFAVLRGRRDYYRNLQRARQTHVELRRNVHRLEKGMSMRPRRPVFAKDYIDETIEFYQSAVRLAATTSGSGIDNDELAWAHGVLSHYFEIVDNADPVVAKAAKRFAAAPHIVANGDSGGAVHPFARRDGAVSEVGYDGLLQLAMQRRSVRWFQDKPVPRDLIDKALLVGRQSPTACNRLPYEYLVFDDPEMVKQVASIPSGSGGYYHQIPTVVVVKGNLDSYFSPRDRHVIYIDAALSAMGFMYALETLGLASSVINWPDFEPLEMTMAGKLGLGPAERVIMLIAIGYPDPDGIIPSSTKKSLDVLRRFNELPQK